MKVPKDFIDYSPDDPDLHRRLGRWQFWDTIVKLKREYDDGDTTSDADPFLDWLEKKYGMRVLRENIGNGFTDDYEIVDEKKFLIFMLKYSDKM